MNKGLSEELKPRRGGRSFFYWARRASPGGARGAQATLRVGLCPTRRGFVKKTQPCFAGLFLIILE